MLWVLSGVFAQYTIEKDIESKIELGYHGRGFLIIMTEARGTRSFLVLDGLWTVFY